MNYGNWFLFEDFKRYYYSSTKSPKAEALLTDFMGLYFSYTGRGLHVSTLYQVKNALDAATKKKMKVQLQGMGYTAASIDNLFKKIASWIKANT